MNRMFAIFEREMRKFFRSPVLMIMSMMLPIVQLVILGNAYGGKIRGARVAIVDYDHGPQAVKIREACAAIAVNIATFKTVDYSNEVQAREDVRTGKIDAAIIIPAQYSRRVYAQDAPRLGLVVDNSDQFTSSSIESELQSLVDALNAPVIQPRIVNNIALAIRRALSLCLLHEVPARRHHLSGDVYLGHDRRRHVVHRRQGPRRPRGLSRNSHHQARAGHGAQPRRRQPRPCSPASASPSSAR